MIPVNIRASRQALPLRRSIRSCSPGQTRSTCLKKLPASRFGQAWQKGAHCAPKGDASTANVTDIYVGHQGQDTSQEHKHHGNGNHHVSNGHAKGSNHTLAEASAPLSVPSPVEQALQEAQAAMVTAEDSLQSIPELRSADPKQLPPLEPPSRLMQLWSTAKQIAPIVILVAGLELFHAFGLVAQWFGATLGGLTIAVGAYMKSSLSKSGAIAAFVVGTATMGCSLRFGCTLLAFFISSSLLTQYKEELKQGLDDSSKKGGQRSWLQVLANGGVPTILAVAYGLLAGCVDLPMGPSPHLEAWRAEVLTMLMGAFMGYYACCNGDTWASELGPLSSDTPRLITNLRPVRKGTNGGVTYLGLVASCAGGCLVGFLFWLAGIISPTLWIFPLQRDFATAQVQLIPLGMLAGFVGSVLDSLLGATLQYTGWDRTRQVIVSRPGPDVTHISGIPILSNNMVNFLSATITATATAFAARYIFL